MVHPTTLATATPGRFLVSAALFLGLLTVPAVLMGTVLHVPSDVPTVQGGIDAAASGDTVLVAPGTYKENINFHGKAITVTSDAGPAVTIIDGQGLSSVVEMISSEPPTAVISGFTLTNGAPGSGPIFSPYGGGIWLYASSPTIRGNIFHGNRSSGSGGGVSGFYGSPTIESNSFTGNQGSGAINLWSATAPVIRGNVITDNDSNAASGAGGGIYLYAFGALVQDNIVMRNNAGICAFGVRFGDGGGIYIIGTAILVVQNLIAGNCAGRGGGIFAFVYPEGSLFLNNTIADNQGNLGSQFWVSGLSTNTYLVNNAIVATQATADLVTCDPLSPLEHPAFDSNNVFGSATASPWSGCPDPTGTRSNISQPPAFVDGANGNYRPASGSSLIDAGNTSVMGLPLTDLDGRTRVINQKVDIGAYEFGSIAQVPVLSVVGVMILGLALALAGALVLTRRQPSS